MQGLETFGAALALSATLNPLKHGEEEPLGAVHLGHGHHIGRRCTCHSLASKAANRGIKLEVLPVIRLPRQLLLVCLWLGEDLAMLKLT